MTDLQPVTIQPCSICGSPMFPYWTSGGTIIYVCKDCDR